VRSLPHDRTADYAPVGYDLHGGEQGIGYSNLTPDPRGGLGGKKKKRIAASPEKLGKPAKRVS